MPQGLFAKLVKERPKSPPEVLSKAVAALQSLSPYRDSAAAAAGTGPTKEQAQVHKYLGYLKFFLFGDEQGAAGAHDPTKESVMSLVNLVVKTDFQLLLVENLGNLEFEARKDAAQVFGAIVRIRDDGQDPACPGATYVLHHQQILRMLFEGYDMPSIALNCGSMYRDCIRDEALAKAELYSEHFMEFFDRVEVANFEIASDAFSSFKDLLTRHKRVVAQYLADNYQPFFEAYNRLLKSSNYVTRRQSLKLLSELLLDVNNVRLMLNYVSDVQNLMQMMNMLKDTSRSIQFEAFHVFKVFVANPKKPSAIVEILVNNRSKLLKYLEDFHTDRDEDEQFKEEKQTIIAAISKLEISDATPPTAAPAAAQPQQQQQQQQQVMSPPAAAAAQEQHLPPPEQQPQVPQQQLQQPTPPPQQLQQQGSAEQSAAAAAAAGGSVPVDTAAAGGAVQEPYAEGGRGVS